MILYQPLETCMLKLEELAKVHDRKGFVAESVQYFALLGEMDKRMRLVQLDPREDADSTRHYQTRYEQLKLMLGRE